tara:strand:+ start:326 stop:1117 length:792 start_codon:yes stop_codon:yes gene_type:complete
MLIGISGKKQSGKSSLANYIKAWYMKRYFKSSTHSFYQNNDGSIAWKYTKFPGITEDPINPTGDDRVKIYSFADPLKKEVCIDVLGLRKEQCYGTDEQKNSLTKYYWENLPIDIRVAYSEEIEDYEVPHELSGESEIQNFKVPRSGLITARELMQCVGTDVFRKMFNQDVWVNATLRIVDQEHKELSIISDVRFESEVNAVLKKGGYIIRLLRLFEEDSHSSETALDSFNFEKNSKQVLIINNDDITMDLKNTMAINWLEEKI